MQCAPVMILRPQLACGRGVVCPVWKPSVLNEPRNGNFSVQLAGVLELLAAVSS